MATKNAVGNSLTGSTGTGAFVGATSPSIATPTITGLSSVTVATGDKIVLLDVSNSDTTAYATTQGIVDLSFSQATDSFIHVARSGTQTINTATYTKVQLNSEVSDASGTFDSTTNYRHTPTKAGTYLYIGAVTLNSSVEDGRAVNAIIYKNGALLSAVFVLCSRPSGTQNVQAAITALVPMNGSTDYIELYVLHGATGSVDIINNTGYTYLQGVLI